MTKLVILTQPDCHSCETLQALLAQLADEFVFEVHEVALADAEGQALAQRHGVAWAPGLLLDDSLVCFGRPSERRIRRDLGRHGCPPRPSGAHPHNERSVTRSRKDDQ